MKIVEVIQRYPPALGGSETWCREVSQYLAGQGHQVRVLTMNINREEEYWKPPVETPGRNVAFGRLDFDGAVVVRRYLHSLPIHSVYHEVYRKILDEQLGVYFYGPHSAEMYGRMGREFAEADVVMLHTVPHPHNLIAFAVARIMRKRIVMVPYFHPSHAFYERPITYFMMRECDALIALSEYEKDYLSLQGIPAEKIHVTGCGIYPEDYRPAGLDEFRARMKREYGLAETDRVVTFIGRKTPEKGVYHLMEAVRGLVGQMPVKLFLAGPKFEAYEKLYASLSAEERKQIVDVGVLTDQEKANLLHLSDLLVLPSKYESFGIVFLEAWICGVPVLGTTEGCQPSVIGEGGYTSQFGDPAGLREKLRKLLLDPVALERVGKLGHKRLFEHFTWPRIGAKVEEVLHAVVLPDGRGRRVVLCANAYPPNVLGGAEITTHHEAKLLKKRGFDVLVFAGELDENRERHSIREDCFEGIPVHRVCLHRRDYSTECFNFFHRAVQSRFEEFLARFSPEIVHFHNIVGLSVSLIRVAARRRMKTLLTVHDHWGFCLKNTRMKTVTKVCLDSTRCVECLPTISGMHWRKIPVRLRRDFLAYQLEALDQIVSPSEYLAEAYAANGVPSAKITVIPYPLDLRPLTKVVRRNGDARVRFTFVGYFGQHKGVHSIMEALPMLAAQKDQIVLNMVGDGELRPAMVEQVARLGWDDSVRFWGKIENSRMDEVYSHTDVLLLPSVWPENQPVTITEATAARIPVIAARIGGNIELIDNGQTGYLFRTGDAEDLAAKMSEFVADRTKIDRFGQNAFQKLPPGRVDEMIGRLVKLFTQEADRPGEIAEGPPMIVCVGEEFSELSTEAMTMVEEETLPWRIVMADWIEEEELSRCKVLWVVDPSIQLPGVLAGMRNQLPLLVPAASAALADLCAADQCGLPYSTPGEAIEGLRYLLENEEARVSMGRNGFRAFYAGALASGL